MPKTGLARYRSKGNIEISKNVFSHLQLLSTDLDTTYYNYTKTITKFAIAL